jgi:hypothetical protein
MTIKHMSPRIICDRCDLDAETAPAPIGHAPGVPLGWTRLMIDPTPEYEPLHLCRSCKASLDTWFKIIKRQRGLNA